MKRPYVAPQLEVEVYELSTSIASNCDVVVYNGPAMWWGSGDNDHHHEASACKSYIDIVGDEDAASDYNVNFYDSGCCDCYTTGSGHFWAS
ncbi:MAG: hypothetical protein LUH09_00075 [Clostridiales bacterium]|nr:hypothetical protein [Clostridiales bacterium]